ncbi:AIM18 [Candida pseudojiufengensis]|uniref:AIM18 n=1 Tax=Candida pseudojiufengensis TaxID=497109 RepID=UPI00222419DF|nr:AIM18 [Candida pseudojiufengensis]KAI5965153.1 AIM18 [Candida pseudojiufengensis]
MFNSFKLLRLRPIRLLPIIAISTYTITNQYKWNNSRIYLDSQLSPQPPQSIIVDSSISPFPKNLKKSSFITQDYTLLGHGVRSVTFISFKVYGIAIYIANSDLSKTQKILKEYELNNPDPEHKSLNNPKESDQIIESLLNHNIRFLIRLSPVRNTDFNHLKDGLIKSILAFPNSKNLKSELNPGLEELRNVFSKTRGSVPKDDLLVMEILKNGELAITYLNQKKDKVKELGVVENPLIGKILMQQYLSSKKPLSESLKNSCIDGLNELI